MTRWKSHLICLGRIVCDDEISSTVRVILARIDDCLNLIDTFTIKISPLIAVDWSELAPFFCKISISFYFLDKYFHFFFPFWRIFWIFFFEGILFEISLKWPLIPDSDIIVDEIFDICIPRKKPKKLMNNSFCKNLLGSEKRKTSREITSKLIPKNTSGPSTSTVCAVYTVVHYVLKEIEVGLHGKLFLNLL